MKFTLIIRSTHLGDSYTALKFAQALIQKHHTITCLYFIFNSVYMANKNIDMPSDEHSLSQEWSKFALDNKLELTICAASGLRRGINEDCLATGFKIGSIGQLVDSCAQADRVVSL